MTKNWSSDLATLAGAKTFLLSVGPATVVLPLSLVQAMPE